MKVANKRYAWFTTLLLIILASSIWFFLHMRQQQNRMNINCATIVRYNHQAPPFIATLDMIFRLNPTLHGQVILSGEILSAQGVETISRTIMFSYEVSRPGEITVKNMYYIKNKPDTASDENFIHSFLYVSEGTTRQLELSPLGNGWLIENPQSPFALCVNKDR